MEGPRAKWFTERNRTSSVYESRSLFKNKRLHFVFETELYFDRREWTALRRLSCVGHFLLHCLTIYIIIATIRGHLYLVVSMKSKGAKEIKFYTLNDIDTACAKIAVPKRNKYGIFLFHHIPYAVRPIGNFRFRNPVYTLTFEECYGAFWNSRSPSQRSYRQGHIRYLATPADIVCLQHRYQRPINGSESCLTLSIVTSQVHLSTISPKKLQPVVVYIGGHNFMESNPTLPSSRIVADLNIVYVTVNYRLDVFGFLDFRKEPFKGNQGVMDVTMALDWIQTYIQAFGGDKTRVTFYGDRSGATIGLSLLRAKKKERFFDKMWLFRGSVRVPEAPKSPFVAEDIMAATPQRCHQKSHVSKKVDCMTNLDAQFIITKTPLAWRKIDNYFCSVPTRVEKKVSLILPRYKSMDPISLVSESGYLGEIDPLPLTLVSTTNDIPVRLSMRSRHVNQTKTQMEDEIKGKLATFQTSGSTVHLGNEIMKIAKEVIKDLQGYLKMTQQVNELGETIGFEKIIKYLISDTRIAIPYNYITKFLNVNGHLQRDMYRLLDISTVGQESAFDHEGRPCDVPMFLIDENHSCKFKKKTAIKLFGESCEEYRKEYLTLFSKFIYRNVNKTKVKEARYPNGPEDLSFTETFNFIANAGFAPLPDVRTNFLLTTADRWKLRGKEREMIEQTAALN